MSLVMRYSTVEGRRESRESERRRNTGQRQIEGALCTPLISDMNRERILKTLYIRRAVGRLPPSLASLFVFFSLLPIPPSLSLSFSLPLSLFFHSSLSLSLFHPLKFNNCSHTYKRKIIICNGSKK